MTQDKPLAVGDPAVIVHWREGLQLVTVTYVTKVSFSTRSDDGTNKRWTLRGHPWGWGAYHASNPWCRPYQPGDDETLARQADRIKRRQLREAIEVHAKTANAAQLTRALDALTHDERTPLPSAVPDDGA